MTAGRRRDEAILERQVLVKFGQLPGVAIFKNEVGKGFYRNIEPQIEAIFKAHCVSEEVRREVSTVLKRSTVTYGLHVGSSDLIAVVGPLGRLAAIELKSPLGTLEPEQRTFLTRMRELGAVAGEARSEDDVARLIESARRGG